ncbi:MAG: non-ribosomal peptide synthetase, partial [Acidobacteria bacterium]
AIRTALSGDPTFTELLGRVRQTCFEAYANQELPFEKIVEALQPERDLSRAPLFQVMFNLLPIIKVELPGLTTEVSLLLDTPGSKFDLTLYAREVNKSLKLELVYNTDLFEGERMAEMLSHLKTLLQGAALHPNQPISRLPLLSETDQRTFFGRRNSIRLLGPFTEFEEEDAGQSIPDRFRQQLLKHPENIAVKTKDAELTYSELNCAANRAALAIVARCGVQAERLALLFGHEPQMIAGLLGALKAGKTYVPLDPRSPHERLRQILSDCQAGAILTNASNISLATTLSAGRIEIINLDSEPEAQSSGEIALRVSPKCPAYILYTSGSTGEPKGILQNHRNVLGHIRAYTNSLRIDAKDRLTLFSSYCVDASVMDIFGALLNGATLYPIDIREDGFVGIPGWMNEQRISIYHSTPTVYRHLLSGLGEDQQLESARLVVLGGEEVTRLDVSLYKKYFSDGCIFINGLGPTESTVSLQYFMNKQTENPQNSVPVGYPVEDTEVILLNNAGRQFAVYGM